MGKLKQVTEYLQGKMVRLAEEKGITHADVVAVSQQLDQYVVQIQRNRMAFRFHQEVIKNSRTRSKQNCTGPALNYSDYLGAADLKTLKDEAAESLRVIRPCLERLHPMILAQHSMLVLANQAGYIIHSHGDLHFLTHAAKVQLSEGAGWSERVRGTNAIGTAILEKSPVYVLGEEHYNKANQSLYCAAAPIFDPTGELLAVLDISGYLGDFQPFFPFMVDAAARNIEDWLLLHDKKVHRILEITDRNAKRYLLAFDRDGQMVGGNRAGRTLNKIEWQDTEGDKAKTIGKLFPPGVPHSKDALDAHELSILFER